MVKYIREDSRNLIEALKTNTSGAEEVLRQFKSGSQHLIQSVDGVHLAGAFYNKSKAFFSELVNPTIDTYQQGVDGLKTDTSKYENADAQINPAWDVIDSEKQERLIDNSKRIIARLEIQIEANQTLGMGKLSQSVLEQVAHQGQNLEQLLDAQQQILNEDMAKLNAVKQFQASIHGLFKEPLNKIKLAMQKIDVINDTTINKHTGSYKLPKGIDSSWLKSLKKESVAEAEKANKMKDKLKKYNVYRVDYKGSGGKHHTLWLVENKKTHVLTTDNQLFEWVNENGKELSNVTRMSMEDFQKRQEAGWRKGYNYWSGKKLNPVLAGAVGGSQYIEDGANWSNEYGLSNIMGAVGFGYAVSRMPNGMMSNVTISKYNDINDYKYNAMTNPGPLAELENRPAQNFYGGRYNPDDLTVPKRYFRAGDTSNPLGQWYTTEPPQSVAQVRIDTAVKEQWINPKTGQLEATSPINTVYEVEFPAGTTIYQGPVGTQGGIYQGGLGTQQIYIDKPWQIKGVKIISKTGIK
ncbi:hypothetical protein ACFO26_02980 [Lactococcus nasutitermitis]|uniref:LXG domain-containing protein n=1 Tax=Lactococcus nasutitermitis TaxID=1652957 RepID=A0ABV9JEE2_9LACT|nr:hypothetical protein [Lactococcus nasutitermitis]